MFAALVRFLFGTKHERDARRMRPTVEAINALEPEVQALTDTALRDRTDYQALMYPDGDRPAGQASVSKLYALGGPPRLTHAPDGPALELPGLGPPPTEGERWQPVADLSWSTVKNLLSATRALSSPGERRSYQPAPPNRDLESLPLAVRQGGVGRLHAVGWWRPREGRWLLVVPYQLGGDHGGLGFAVYAPAPGGLQLVAASGEIPLPCAGRDALLLSDSMEELRVVAGCQGTNLTACRVRWEAGALRSTCGGMLDAPPRRRRCTKVTRSRRSSPRCRSGRPWAAARTRSS